LPGVQAVVPGRGVGGAYARTRSRAFEQHQRRHTVTALSQYIVQCELRK
jgi:hypothetical protein